MCLLVRRAVGNDQARKGYGMLGLGHAVLSRGSWKALRKKLKEVRNESWKNLGTELSKQREQLVQSP